MPTSARAFFDTNVLVYVVGQRERRTEIAETVLAGGGVISVQVLNELTNVSRRKLGMSWQKVGEVLEAIQALCPSPVPLTVETHASARRIAAKYGCGIYDGLIAASALAAGCTTLYSEDFQDGQVIDGVVTVRNPFRS